MAWKWVALVWRAVRFTRISPPVWSWMNAITVLAAEQLETLLIWQRSYSVSGWGKLLSNLLKILVLTMTADKSPVSALVFVSRHRNRSIKKKKIIATRCWRIIFIFLENGKRNTLLNSRMRNGIPCLQKHCIRRTISNICLIFFCMVHWRNEKHLWQNRERRC